MASFNFRSRDPRSFTLNERPRPRGTRSETAPVPPVEFQDTTTSADDEGWLASSYELRHGLQVSEESIDTLPAELRDAFDPPPAQPDRRPRRR